MHPDAEPAERILVVGDALLDVAITPSESVRPGRDVPAAIRLGPGGQGANVAVRLARSGLSVTLACGLGDDGAGRLLRAALEADGVALRPVAVTATGAVAVLLDDERDRTMLSQRAPFGARLDAEDLSAAAWIVVSGYILAEKAGADVAERLSSAAPRRVALGCSLLAGAEMRWLAAVESLHPDLLVLSADEARALVPESWADRWTEWLAKRVGALVTVTSTDGAIASGAGVHVEVAVPPALSPALDATGAGDAFAAALIGELARTPRWPPEADVVRAALDAALARAREVVGVPGAQGRVLSEGTPSAMIG